MTFTISSRKLFIAAACVERSRIFLLLEDSQWSQKRQNSPLSLEKRDKNKNEAFELKIYFELLRIIYCLSNYFKWLKVNVDFEVEFIADTYG